VLSGAPCAQLDCIHRPLTAIFSKVPREAPDVAPETYGLERGAVREAKKQIDLRQFLDSFSGWKNGLSSDDLYFQVICSKKVPY
jgi:hypothetical protein